MNDYKWLNESRITFEGDKIGIYATGQSDFFNSKCNAPYYYTEVEGNFVMKVKVSHDFTDTYDSSSIMVMKDLQTWAKACFELTDFGTHAVVSVVTKNDSDDANGCNISGNEVWLQITRVDRTFAFHYSTDGVHFYMMRVFRLPVEDSVKVGLLAQAPVGNGGNRYYEHLTIERKTVRNIRKGE